MLGPATGEAVGLQLLGHRARGEVGPGLYGMAPLVGEHDRNDEITEFRLQFGEKRFGVPCHHILAGAVEGVARDVAGGLGAGR